jgi:hypothetical protein
MPPPPSGGIDVPFFSGFSATIGDVGLLGSAGPETAMRADPGESGLHV